MSEDHDPGDFIDEEDCTQVCKYCNTGNLHWVRICGAWRLFDRNELIHICKKEPKMHMAPQAVQHMSTSHIINRMAWLFRMMMHKKFGLTATKYAEFTTGSIDDRNVVQMDKIFMDSFDVKNAEAWIAAMNKELIRRKKST